MCSVPCYVCQCYTDDQMTTGIGADTRVSVFGSCFFDFQILFSFNLFYDFECVHVFYFGPCTYLSFLLGATYSSLWLMALQIE